jgi:hypothetical protein
MYIFPPFRLKSLTYPKKFRSYIQKTRNEGASGKVTSLLKKLKNLNEDTFLRGAFCGAVAGIVKDVIDSFFYLAKWKEVIFWSFASVLAFHEKPKNLFMHITGFLLEIIFCCFLGIVFTLLTPKIKTKYYLLLGAFYGSTIWFFVKAIIVAYKIEVLKPKTNLNPFLTWLLSIFFGVVLAFLERKLSPKTS